MQLILANVFWQQARTPVYTLH